MIKKVIEYSQDLFILFTVFYFLWILWGFFICFYKENKDNKENKNEDNKNDNNKKNDPFVIVFRKTRTESLIISRIEEICKTRDVQFVISCYYYNNEKSIKGCVYVVTSKLLFKLFFIKTSLISKEIHYFNNFISFQNKSSYNKIINFLDINNNFVKQKHHKEFFTWHHYYLTDNYYIEEEKVEKFLKTC